ncbi:MAG TPA: dihydrolipoamide acetyltransferase family protein [Anaerolineales bacterium]|nr:dihydrolipoamide acetyltransferase family protein [Anaerolineales bacterium]
MPALEMAQDTGKLLRWLKKEGERVTKGEPLMEIETDKVTVEIEAAATGTLTGFRAREGDDIPVGQVIALILADGEPLPTSPAPAPPTQKGPKSAARSLTVSPVAARMAAEHNLDLALVNPDGGRVEKADVLAYLSKVESVVSSAVQTSSVRLSPASPKARRLAQERDLDLKIIPGSGPEGAVLTADVLAFTPTPALPPEPAQPETQALGISNAWRVMAERMTHSWTTVPHFFLLREAHAQGLVDWLASARSRTGEKLTYTDLLVKLIAVALRQHPRINASWQDGGIQLHSQINVGIAVAVEDGLIVPVIHSADGLSLRQIAARRTDVVQRAQSGKLRPDDIRGGTFTVSNLGMYGVDAFNAIINPPQAAILAVGRIADRVVPVNGQVVIQPVITLSLSCDHRAVDGARGAQFLDTLVHLIEHPLSLLD